MTAQPCSIEGCEKIAHARRKCRMHYWRAYRAGELDLRPETFEERFWMKVQKTDTCWNWTASKLDGYGQIRTDSKLYYAHRLSYEWAYGPIPDGMLVDHMCHNPSCVNPVHLRLATKKQNMENLRGAYETSGTGVRGVSWCALKQAWRARVTHNLHVYWCGYHSTIESAEAAVIAKRNELFTHNILDREAAGVRS